MILQALTDLYETLVANGTLQQSGWQPVKVSWGINLNHEGKIQEILDLREPMEKGKKIVLVPQTVFVPARPKRTADISPEKSYFLCDNAEYMLGIFDPEDENSNPEKSKQRNQASKDWHKDRLQGIEHPTVKAIVRFFLTGHPRTQNGSFCPE